ncbi:MAG TPA: hypothetical protein VGO00_28840, partial [Kofleriaceae bacterium]|nr:hypothetical protein [Kofleriaceae bacterium]
ALAMHGRVVEITAGGYTTPWHGTCGEAGRQLTPQILADVDVMHNFGDAQPRFKLPPNVVEYVFTCVDNKRSPQATIYLGNDQAMTCWAGACYLLARRR